MEVDGLCSRDDTTGQWTSTRGWTEYENGFGNMKGEHWLGLKNISCLTGSTPEAQLRVDLVDFEGRHKYARYSYFSVGNPSTNYKLSVGGYSG